MGGRPAGGRPKTRGGYWDRLIVIFANEPYGWAPSVTRSQRKRDLDLLLMHHEMGEEGD